MNNYSTIRTIAVFIDLPSNHWVCCYSTVVVGPQHFDNVTKYNKSDYIATTIIITLQPSFVLYS